MCLRQHVGPYKPLFCCGCLLDFELFFWKLDTSCLLKENEKGRKIKGGKVRKQTDLMFVFGFVFWGVYSFFLRAKLQRTKLMGQRGIFNFFKTVKRGGGEREQEREREEELQRKRRAY